MSARVKAQHSWIDNQSVGLRVNVICTRVDVAYTIVAYHMSTRLRSGTLNPHDIFTNASANFVEKSVSLFITRDMLLLSLTFLYTGWSLIRRYLFI